MLLLRIVYSIQMKQGYHLCVLTAKCFLQEPKIRWEDDVRKEGPQCDISGLCEYQLEIYSALLYFPESKFWPETRVKCTLWGCGNCWEKWMVRLPPFLLVWLNLWGMCTLIRQSYYSDLRWPQQVFYMARKFNVHLLCTPPNQDHKYRLCRELSWISSERAAYSEICFSQMRCNAGFETSKYDRAGLDWSIHRGCRLNLVRNSYLFNIIIVKTWFPALSYEVYFKTANDDWMHTHASSMCSTHNRHMSRRKYHSQIGKRTISQSV
jgi:hypothetical protein